MANRVPCLFSGANCGIGTYDYLVLIRILLAIH